MLTTKQRLQLMDLEDKLHACRKSLTITLEEQEVEEWVDTKIMIRGIQKQLKDLKKLQAA